MAHLFYKMHDSNPSGMFPVAVSEAREENKKGFGIFWTVNSFRGSRKISNLKAINSWAVDIDTGTKEQMLEKIQSGLPPTLVVESKRGFHVYWRAKEALPKHWNSIVLDRLVPFYGADKNARDLARVLRVPGYFHMKNPKDPFLIKTRWEYPCEYTEQDMAYFYPDNSCEQREDFKARAKKESKVGSSDLWEEVWRMDCSEALEKLSGSKHVNFETFSFRNNSKGTMNICVDGKSTSSWIDLDGRIGSMSKGGPTIAQWLRWYGHSWSETISIMQEYFPELPWIKKS